MRSKIRAIRRMPVQCFPSTTLVISRLHEACCRLRSPQLPPKSACCRRPEIDQVAGSYQVYDLGLVLWFGCWRILLLHADGPLISIIIICNREVAESLSLVGCVGNG